MIKTKSFNRNGTFIDHYQLDTKLVIDDIYKIIDVLKSCGITMRGFRLSNSEEQPENFFRIFYGLDEIMSFAWEDVYIDDLGVFCSYNKERFDLTVDLARNKILVFSDGKINFNLESILFEIENATKKKVR